MIENDERNDIIIAQINNSRAHANIFLTKFISHCHKLLKPLEYLAPSVFLPREYCDSINQNKNQIDKLIAPQPDITGKNVFMTYNSAIEINDKMPNFDNCYFLTPVAGAVAMKATRYLRQKRRDSFQNSLKIFDFTDLRIREFSKMARVRKNLFLNSKWTVMHSTQKKYL